MEDQEISDDLEERTEDSETILLDFDEFNPDEVSVEFLNQKDQIALFSCSTAKLFSQLG